MLKEHKHTKQNNGHKFRRWFSDEEFDLIVWFENNKEIHGFQLCYDKNTIEHSLTWINGEGYNHQKVDTGECHPLSPKMSPIMVPDGSFNITSVLERFTTESKEIDSVIVIFIRDKLQNLSKEKFNPIL